VRQLSRYLSLDVCIALHYIALPGMALHCMTSQSIALLHRLQTPPASPADHNLPLN